MIEEKTQPGSVPFNEREHRFGEVTRRALRAAEKVPEPYAGMLRLLNDCEEVFIGRVAEQQRQGASYRQLAAAAHAAGLNKKQRVAWYRLAERLPLSRRHVGHILARLLET